jgi:hypothetical protein
MVLWYDMVWYMIRYMIHIIWYMIWYDICYDMIYDTIWCDIYDIIYDIWYILTAIGLSPVAVHIYTQTIYRLTQITTEHKQQINIKNNKIRLWLNTI